jgi:hypothetical protein
MLCHLQIRDRLTDFDQDLYCISSHNIFAYHERYQYGSDTLSKNQNMGLNV